jgi:hypothetical protein
MQSAQTPIFKLGGVLVSNRSQAIAVLESAKQDQNLLIDKCCSVIRHFSQSSDLGRSPASSLSEVGQEGNQ